MKKFLMLIHAAVLSLATSALAQGTIIPNGVTSSQIDTTFVVNVVRNPTNSTTTGFLFSQAGSTPSGIGYNNTFTFIPIVDVGVRVFFVAHASPLTQATLTSGTYPELASLSSHVFNDGDIFYLGFYTGNQTFAPPDGIYSDPFFGWAKLVNNSGTLQLLDSALVYGAGGILAGTQTTLPVPEPSSFALLSLGVMVLLKAVRRRA